jgi:hypothetical protein
MKQGEHQCWIVWASLKNSATISVREVNFSPLDSDYDVMKSNAELEALLRGRPNAASRGKIKKIFVDPLFDSQYREQIISLMQFSRPLPESDFAKYLEACYNSDTTGTFAKVFLNMNPKREDFISLARMFKERLLHAKSNSSLAETFPFLTCASGCCFVTDPKNPRGSSLFQQSKADGAKKDVVPGWKCPFCKGTGTVVIEVPSIFQFVRNMALDEEQQESLSKYCQDFTKYDAHIDTYTAEGELDADSVHVEHA